MQAQRSLPDQPPPTTSPHAAVPYGIYFLGGKIKKQQGYDFL